MNPDFYRQMLASLFAGNAPVNRILRRGLPTAPPYQGQGLGGFAQSDLPRGGFGQPVAPPGLPRGGPFPAQPVTGLYRAGFPNVTPAFRALARHFAPQRGGQF